MPLQRSPSIGSRRRTRAARRPTLARVTGCVLACALALALSACASDTSDSGDSTSDAGRPLDLKLREALVTKVVDGDTVHVRLMGSGRKEKIRLIGVDTPESTNEIEPYGPEASAYAKGKLDGTTVYLETDAELRDRYGRLLAYLWMSRPTLADEDDMPAFSEVRTRMFNGWLLRDGYAQVLTVPPNVKYAEDFLVLQQEARKAERGLWGRSASRGGVGELFADAADGRSLPTVRLARSGNR